MGGRNNWKISTSFFPFLFFFLSLFFTRDQFPPSDIYFKIHGHNVLICSTLYTYTYLVVRNNVFPTYLNLVIPRPFRGLPHCLVATRKHAVIVLAWLVSHNHPDERSIERRSRERERVSKTICPPWSVSRSHPGHAWGAGERERGGARFTPIIQPPLSVIQPRSGCY